MRKFKLTEGLTVLALVLVATISACGSEDPTPTNDNELITTVNLTFTNNGMTDEVVTASFRDVDGPGGEDPVITDAQLNANSSYTLNVQFLNDSGGPVENITEEIVSEGLDHQVFYVIGGTANLSYSYGDQDSQGNPIGITGTLTTGAAGNGTLRIILLHNPVKSASGVANGDIGNAGGEEDIRVQFNIRTQ